MIKKEIIPFICWIANHLPGQDLLIHYLNTQSLGLLFFFIDYLPKPNAIKSWLGFVVDLSCPTNRKPWNCSVSFMFSWLTSLVWTCHMLINTFSPKLFYKFIFFFKRQRWGSLPGRTIAPDLKTTFLFVMFLWGNARPVARVRRLSRMKLSNFTIFL